MVDIMSILFHLQTCFTNDIKEKLTKEKRNRNKIHIREIQSWPTLKKIEDNKDLMVPAVTVSGYEISIQHSFDKTEVPKELMLLKRES